MSMVTQQQLLNALQNDWARYVEAFKRLNVSEQVAFLEKQGYARFHDLLAHVIAWWEEALEIVTSILDGRELPQREYDIDAFNVQAVTQYKDWKEGDLLAHYENLREALLDLVADLPEGALKNKRIAGWLHACIVEHAEEHRIA